MLDIPNTKNQSTTAQGSKEKHLVRVTWQGVKGVREGGKGGRGGAGGQG